MENLNKENFFNEMAEKYPEAMQKFCNWIDVYKSSVNWIAVFNGTTEEEIEANAMPSMIVTGNISDFNKHTEPGKIIIIEGVEEITPSICYIPGMKQAPKFHDIPFFLQLGILMAWVDSIRSNKMFCSGSQLVRDGININCVKTQLAIMFDRYQNDLLTNKK